MLGNLVYSYVLQKREMEVQWAGSDRFSLLLKEIHTHARAVNMCAELGSWSLILGVSGRRRRWIELWRLARGLLRAIGS